MKAYIFLVICIILENNKKGVKILKNYNVLFEASCNVDVIANSRKEAEDIVKFDYSEKVDYEFNPDFTIGTVEIVSVAELDENGNIIS